LKQNFFFKKKQKKEEEKKQNQKKKKPAATVKNLHVLEYSIMTPFKIKTCHFGQNIAKVLD